MKWLTKLFDTKDPDIEQLTESTLSARVAEIQTRITALRSSIERPNKPPTATQTSTQPVVATESPKHNREAEMMALKAKLLGKKS